MKPFSSKDLYEMKWASDPNMSPSGDCVVFTVKAIIHEDKVRKYRTNVWMAREGQVFPLTQGSSRDVNPRWSPDGSKIAFLSDRDKDKTQIYLISLSGGEASKLTSGKEGVGELCWSPAGDKIAFTALGDHAQGQNGNGEVKDADDEKSDVRVITRIRYKMNGRGFLPDKPSQIFTIDVNTGELVQLTTGPYDCREPAWSRDGRKIAFVSARFEDRDLSSIRDIYVVDVATKEMTRITSSQMVASSPSWSPDGDYIAFYGHDNSYGGATLPSVCIIPAKGGPVTYLTRSSELSTGMTAGTDMVSPSGSPPVWSADGKWIYFTALAGGATHLYRVRVEDGKLEKLTHGDYTIYGWSKASGKDTFVFCITSFDNIGDLFTFNCDDGSMVKLTHLNEDLLSSRFISLPEHVEVKHSDGTVLDAWIMKPIGFQENKKYPVVLEIHGGPHSAYGYAFFHEFQLLASRGYGVVFGNPRGSVGYGQAFVAATKCDWGGKDYEDIMAIAEMARNLPWVDSSRMGVTGGSYGGYMTNWIVGHTDMFKAAVTQRSTCNRMSQFGTSDTAYMNGEFEFPGDPWDNPMAYLERSPIMYVRNVKTPVLILHSEEDLRCPISQAEEFFVALKKLKKECVMVRFPGENHELSRSGKPVHRVERLEYIVAWFDRFLAPRESDYAVPLGKPELKVKLA